MRRGEGSKRSCEFRRFRCDPPKRPKKICRRIQNGRDGTVGGGVEGNNAAARAFERATRLKTLTTATAGGKRPPSPGRRPRVLFLGAQRRPSSTDVPFPRRHRRRRRRHKHSHNTLYGGGGGFCDCAQLVRGLLHGGPVRRHNTRPLVGGRADAVRYAAAVFGDDNNVMRW